MDSNLLKEAIADAKAVRQTAIANAKVALEEAFNQKYQAMFAEKLKEEAAVGDEAHGADAAANDALSEQEVNDLIKELEAEVGAESPHAEPDGDESAPVAPTAPVGAPSPVGAPMPSVPPGCPPVGAPSPVGASPIPPVPPAPVGGEVPPAPVGGEIPPAPVAPAAPVGGEIPPATPPSDALAGDDEEVDLNELLQSLKEEIEDEEESEESLDESKKLASSGIGGNKAGGSDNKKPSASANSSSGIESGGLKQEGVPSPEGTKIGPEDATKAPRPNQSKNATSTNQSTPSLGGQSGPALKATRPNGKGEFENTAKLHEENETLKKQLSEAYQTITYVKGQLNEINLLNAKLLYTNKLFKEFNMTNEQKMRVVEMFDLGKNVREVKLTYANIAESLNFSGVDLKRKVQPKSSVQSITEGLASQPVGSTKPSKALISEGKTNEMVARFQQIAGIKPTKK